MIKLPKKIQCIGSKTPGIKNHSVVHISSVSRNYICDLKECAVLYYNFEVKMWVYRPGTKIKALETSKD